MLSIGSANVDSFVEKEKRDIDARRPNVGETRK